MAHTRLLLAALVFGGAFATCAFDEEAEAPGCLVAAPLTPAIVRDAVVYDLDLFAAPGAPTFLAGGLSPTRDSEEAELYSGAVVFVRDSDGSWRALLPRPGEGIVGVFAAPSGGVIIATMWQTEGPGASWTLMRSNDGFASGACVTLDFPDTLNQPTWANEFLDLTDLDIAANGRGEVIGVARTEDERERYYVYRTRDHGATWSAPRRLWAARAARRGDLAPVQRAPAPEALVAELTAYAERNGE